MKSYSLNRALRRLFIFVFAVGLTGCVNYQNTVVVGKSKHDIFDSLGWDLRRDFTQVYYDPNTQIEVFAPVITDKEIASGPSDTPSEVLIFGGVTQPTRCPISALGGESWDRNCRVGRLDDYPAGYGFCFNGDGYLKERIDVNDVVQGYIGGQKKHEPLMAALELFYEEQETHLKRFIGNGWSTSQAKSLVLCERKKEHIKHLKLGQEVFDYWRRATSPVGWGGALGIFNDKIATDPQFYPKWENRYLDYRERFGSSGQVASRKVPQISGNESFMSAELFDLLSLALDIWVATEILEARSGRSYISSDDLQRIEDAAARGAARGSMGRGMQGRAMRNVQRLYCKQSEGKKYAISRDC